jgi:hypothetical protein
LRQRVSNTRVRSRRGMRRGKVGYPDLSVFPAFEPGYYNLV